MVDFVRNSSIFVQELWDGDGQSAVTSEVKNGIYESLSHAFIDLHIDIGLISASRDSQNEALYAEEQVIVPVELVNVTEHQFSELLRGHKGRMEAIGWDISAREKIFAEFKTLRGHRNDAAFQEYVTRSSTTKFDFDELWDNLPWPLDDLRHFCATIATVFPNTASVESDFSVIGYEKNPYRSRLSDFSLESILHAKQFETLCGMLGK
jgi:hypothetical protein